MSDEFEVKDSGERKQFDSGMVRDTAEGKVNFLLVRPGPMLRRWATHLTKAEAKYPPPEIGVPNWTLADGPEELDRFRQSAARHFESWLANETDEDHAAGVIFNINGAEYVKAKLAPTYERADQDEYCNDEGPEGWYCERVAGHDGEHWFPVEEYSVAGEASPTWPGDRGGV